MRNVHIASMLVITLLLSACSNDEDENDTAEYRNIEGCPPILPDNPPRHADLEQPSSINPELPDVLLIGDSISVGYTPHVRTSLEGEVNLYRIPDNGRQTCYGLAMLDDWLAINDGQWDLIHFNWGLHNLAYPDGAVRTTPEDYAWQLERLVDALSLTRAKLVWAETTPIPAGADRRVEGSENTYNIIAAEIMAKHNVTINPLHKGRWNDFQTPANVHYEDKGSSLMGKQVAEVIRNSL